jgi:hypothetical protein
MARYSTLPLPSTTLVDPALRSHLDGDAGRHFYSPNGQVTRILINVR